MRIGDDFLDDPVAAARRWCSSMRKPERDRRKLFELAVEVPPLVVKKRTAVGDQVLQVADLRPVDRRVIDLADDARGQREPDAARRRIGRADGRACRCASSGARCRALQRRDCRLAVA